MTRPPGTTEHEHPSYWRLAHAVLARPTGARLLVVEDHAILAVGLEMALAGCGWNVETSNARTPVEIVEHANRLKPHCVLLSVHLGAGAGVGDTLIGPLASTGAQVLLITAERRRTVLARFLEAGAAGWIGRETALEEVDATLSRLVEGKPVIGKTLRASLIDDLRIEREREMRARATFEELTHREALVLAAMIDGLTAEEIAQDHVVAVCTVRSQIRAVLQKFNVRSQLAAVAIASAHRDLLPCREQESPDRRRRRARAGEQRAAATVGSA